MLYGVFAAYMYSKTSVSAMTRWLGPNEANPDLHYVDTTANGYGLASFDASELRVQLITMQDCRPNFVQPPAIKHIARFRLPRWHPGDVPELEGPYFDRGAPFPFETPTV